MSAEKPVVIWKGGETKDFRLSLSFRVSSANNSGIQYRSKHITEGKVRNPWVVRGYQHEIRNSGQLPSVAGFIYEEGGRRGRMCHVGEKATWNANGKKEVTDSLIDRPGLKWWAIDTAVVSATTWGATLAFNKNIRDDVMDSSGRQWLENISQAPEWNDGSDAVTNYVAHPLLGAGWFLTYRSRGHGLIASSLGLIFQSFWLEYAVEGPHKLPSAHDLLMTPLLGIPIGYGLDSLSVYLLKKDRKPWRYLGYVFNPFRLLPTAKNQEWSVAIDPARKSFAVSGRF